MNRVRELLEVTYPMGSEVYRDENGSIFVVPDVYDILESANNKGIRLLKLIQQEFAQGTIKDQTRIQINGEITPQIELEPNSWWGQDPDWPASFKDELPNIERFLSNQIALCTQIDEIEQYWNSKTNVDICTVCGLRPQGRSKKAAKRKVCDICEKRRADRSNAWATSQFSKTIWTDEVADGNGRLALLVGYFDLLHWLDGKLLDTMLLIAPQDPQNTTNKPITSKTPSFSRLRRIWMTTRDFWQEVCPTDGGEAIDKEKRTPKKSLIDRVVDQAGPRIVIRGHLRPKEEGRTPGDFHACDLVLSDGIKMSVVWDPDNSRFITADNLAYLKEQLGRNVESALKELTDKRATLLIEEPTGYGAKKNIWGTISLDSESVKTLDIKYAPFIPILAEPRTFMALVPAEKALEVIEAIQAKYEREMGKVRNRLPLHLGLVYTHRRTPLRAILDAGRRMLDQSAKPEGWKIVRAAQKLIENDDELPRRFKDDESGQFHEWYEILLEKDGRRLTWCVPAVMGDSTTPDLWYPYVFLNTFSEPSDRDKCFQAPNPWTGSDGWLVHVADLKRDDSVYFTPATLDFQWLDSAGRRFEIAYNAEGDAQGQRRNLPCRPYLLDELDDLESIWETLKHHLSKNQIYALRDLIEAKRVEWQVTKPELAEFDLQGKLIQQPDDVFWQFCYDSLANAEWKKGKMPWQVEEKDREIWLARWANYVACGWFADVVELHLHIMKEEVIS